MMELVVKKKGPEAIRWRTIISIRIRKTEIPKYIQCFVISDEIVPFRQILLTDLRTNLKTRRYRKTYPAGAPFGLSSP